MFRRTAPNHLEERQEECNTIVRQLVSSGRGLLYGCRFMQLHLRQCYDQLFSRRQVLRAQKEADPRGVRYRQLTNPRVRVEFITRGPNHIGSVDGDNKLAYFGIQIYTGMDVLSRFLLWCYVGVSNRTAVSVHKQYLKAVLLHSIIPHQIRSDKGKETLQMANSQVILRRAVLPQEAHDQFDFRSAFIYGTSKKNQRIEAWWRHLSEHVTKEWVIRFKKLEALSM